VGIGRKLEPQPDHTKKPKKKEKKKKK